MTLKSTLMLCNMNVNVKNWLAYCVCVLSKDHAPLDIPFKKLSLSFELHVSFGQAGFG